MDYLSDPFDGDVDIDYEQPANMPDSDAAALERASWHLRMAAKYANERRQLVDVYQAEMDRLTARLDHRVRILDARIAWHEAPVEALHRALLEADPKRKTIELPYGTSRVRVSKTPRIEFVDKAATLAWAENTHPDILGRTINVTGVKTIANVTDAGVVDDNGELIPGVAAVLDEPSWSVSYDTEASS